LTGAKRITGERIHEYLNNVKGIFIQPAIQTVGEGNGRKDGWMARGMFSWVGRRGGESFSEGVYILWAGLRGRPVR
jgi:hypothetical protein